MISKFKNHHVKQGKYTSFIQHSSEPVLCQNEHESVGTENRIEFTKCISAQNLFSWKTHAGNVFQNIFYEMLTKLEKENVILK